MKKPRREPAPVVTGFIEPDLAERAGVIELEKLRKAVLAMRNAACSLVGLGAPQWREVKPLLKHLGIDIKPGHGKDSPTCLVLDQLYRALKNTAVGTRAPSITRRATRKKRCRISTVGRYVLAEASKNMGVVSYNYLLESVPSNSKGHDRTTVLSRAIRHLREHGFVGIRQKKANRTDTIELKDRGREWLESHPDVDRLAKNICARKCQKTRQI